VSDAATVELYDTTLRDGAQRADLSYSIDDRLRILHKLDQVGFPYVEGGWPGANPRDTEFFKLATKESLANAQLTAFGMTRKAGERAADSQVLRDLLEAGTEVVCLVGKAWDLHVTEALRTDLDDFARRARRRRDGAQHAARITEPRGTRFVQQVRVDPCDLWRDVGAHADEPPRQRVDDLERLQVEVASAARQQRFEMLDERRLHQPITVRGEMVEQRAPQRFQTRSLVGQHVFDRFGDEDGRLAAEFGLSFVRR